MWPANSGYNDWTICRISTTYGWATKTVSQRTNGGKWVYLGTFTMNAGDGWFAQISNQSSGTGYIIADAVRLVRVTGIVRPLLRLKTPL